MGVKVIKSGLFTSVQDMGRVGVACFGVPQSGAMDQYAAKIANLLVGNTSFEPLLEITLAGPTLEFQEPCLIAISGLGINATKNDEKLSSNERIHIKAGDRVVISQVTKGTRVYLAVQGGFISEEIMGSQSMYHPITKYSKLEPGMELNYAKTENFPQMNGSTLAFENEFYDSSKLTVFRGPEFNKLSKENREKIEKEEFTISKNNSRMAYQLEDPFENNLGQILTQPVLPGTVQLTPSGKIIVLMRDCQSTGGYPRILQFTEESLNVLAQKKSGQPISFQLQQN